MLMVSQSPSVVAGLHAIRAIRGPTDGQLLSDLGWTGRSLSILLVTPSQLFAQFYNWISGVTSS